MAAAPIPEFIHLLKSDRNTILRHGHPEVFIARAPGRLDVMGGIADYTGSLVCEMPLDLAAAVAVQRRDDRKVVVKTYSAEALGGGRAAEETVELSLDDFYGTAALLPTETLQALFKGARRWAAYIAGAFPVLNRHKKFTRRTHGANIACYTDVPVGTGLASSSAVECATLCALTAAYHLILDPLEIALLAQRVENLIVGSPCGVMDPVTSMLGKADQLLLMECRPHEIKGYLPAPTGTFFAAINSGVRHAVAEGWATYRTGRVSAFMAQVILTRAYPDKGKEKDPMQGYLASVPVEAYEKELRGKLPETITGAAFTKAYGATGDRLTSVEPGGTYFPRAAADHHVREAARVQAFVETLRAGGRDGAAAAGKLMLESHRSYSENARLGSAETDLLVELVMERGPGRGLYGARVTGGGGGGTVAVLADSSEAARRELAEVAAAYEKRTGRQARLFLASSAGVSETPALKVPLAELSP